MTMNAVASPRETPQPDRPPGGTAADDDAPLHETHAYWVELWDDSGARVERLLAVARSAALGYVCYFAAAEDFPHRVVTLSRQGVVLSRWSVDAIRLTGRN